MSLESSTVASVTLALDASTLRHQAIAANIANANTPGYVPVRVSFEEHLGALRDSLAGGRVEPSMLAASQPRVEAAAAAPVALDQEVARLSSNALHYQALLRALNKQFSILAAAINDGKR